jgi:hypothetical protein
LYEEIASKQRYSMLPEATRSKMLSQIDDSLKAMDVDGGDYQNFRSYLFDEYGFPNETAFKETGSNVIPFKPRTKKFMGGIIPEELLNNKTEKKIETELGNPRYNSNTGEYEIGGGVKLGDIELDMLARGLEGYDPIMQYEGMLDLGNDFMLKGGYYDDAIMESGMMSPEDEIKLSLIKSFANGGTVPPLKGPMSGGMGSLFRSK